MSFEVSMLCELLNNYTRAAVSLRIDADAYSNNSSGHIWVKKVTGVNPFKKRISKLVKAGLEIDFENLNLSSKTEQSYNWKRLVK